MYGFTYAPPSCYAEHINYAYSLSASMELSNEE